MNRKKFFTLFSASILGVALLKANPLNLFVRKKVDKSGKSVRVKINPKAVYREKSGKYNG